MAKRFAHGLAAAALATLTALPASADIAAFNAAMKASDYKAAAVQAASTWPTIDKARPDIADIASEFGFAAYMAGDYAATKTYASAATGDPITLVLLRMAEHRLAPSADTRQQLAAALEARAAAVKGLDSISFLAADLLVSYDFKLGHWPEVWGSSDLAVKLTEAGGPPFLSRKRRFQLYSAIGQYMVTRKSDAWDKIVALRRQMEHDMDAAPDDTAARQLVPLYWEATAWADSIFAHLTDRSVSTVRMREYIKEDIAYSPRVTALLDRHPKKEVCPRRLIMTAQPDYPESVIYKGFVGAVILSVDLNAQGQVTSANVLASVPEKGFSDAVMKGAPLIRYTGDKGWNPATCSLAEKGHIIRFNFMIGGRDQDARGRPSTFHGGGYTMPDPSSSYNPTH